MKRSRGFGHRVCGLRDLYNTVICALSCAMRLLQKKNNCRDWDFSNSELDVWLPGFQLPMFPKVTHCRKEICWTCLFKESIPAIPFWNSKHPTYQKLEVPESRSTFRHLCIKWWHHAHPFVAAAEKECVMQRSRGFGHRSCGPKNCHNIVILLSVVLWDCCKKWTIVEIEILAAVSWTCGCQPLSCRCSQTVMHCRKEICWTCLFQELMPFVKSKPPLPTRSLRFLRAAAGYTSSALWLHHAHPFVAAAEKNTISCREAEGLPTELSAYKICYGQCSDCVQECPRFG